MPELEDKQIVKLKKLLAIMDEDSLTRQEFSDAFQKVLELVVKVQKDQQEAIKRIEETYTLLTEQNRKKHEMSLSELKEKTNQLFVGERLDSMSGEMKNNMTEMKRMMHEMIDRKMKEMDSHMSALSAKGEISKKEMKDMSLLSKAELEAKMKEMDNHKLLDIEAIRDLKNEFEKVKKVLSDIPRGKAMGRVKVPIIRAIDLTASVDGSTTSFTLEPDVVRVLGVWGTQFPITFRQNVDWTFSGRTLSLVAAQVGTPQSGQTLWCLAETLFYP